MYAAVSSRPSLLVRHDGELEASIRREPSFDRRLDVVRRQRLVASQVLGEVVRIARGREVRVQLIGLACDGFDAAVIRRLDAVARPLDLALIRWRLPQL